MLERAGRPRRGARPDRDRAHPVQAGRRAARPSRADEQRSAIRPSRSRRRARCARFAAARPTASFRWPNTKPGRTSTSISIRVTCSAADAHDQTWEHDDAMTETPSSPFGFTRRRVLALGAAASARPARCAGIRADCSLDVTQGNVAPLLIAIPDFVGGTPGDAEVARGISQVITANLRRSGLFAPIDPAAYIEKITSFDMLAALSRLEGDQRAGADHRARHAPGRRAAQGRVPAVGRDLRPAAHRPAIFHQPGQLAAHRAYRVGSGLRAADRREGLFRHAHRVHRRDRREGAPRQAPRDHGPGRRATCAI